MKNELRENGAPVFDFATGISLLLYYPFAMQCISTLAIVKRETNPWKWSLIQLAFMSGFAYLSSLVAYPIIKIMMQQILVYIAVAVSVVFLIKKFFGNKKPKKGCGTDNCGCH